MKRIKIAGLTAFLLAAAWLVPPIIHRALRLCPLRPEGIRTASALPQWARRYGFECGVCHTTVPRLNQFGYNFRRAGFRLPDEYDQEAKFAGLKDITSAKVTSQYQVTTSATDGTAANAKVQNNHSFLVPGFDFMPMSGAFGKYWATRAGITFHAGDTPELEQAYGRATRNFGDLVLWTAAGIMPAFHGYGASDDPLGNMEPLFRANSAKFGAFDSMVTLRGQSQLGAEVGAGYKDTTVSLAVFNGLNTKSAAANQGANNNHYDLRLFANQMIGEKAAASLEYLNGKTDWGVNGAAPAAAKADLTQNPVVPIAAVPAVMVNNYQRLSAYANYELLGEKLNLLGGWDIGSDHLPNQTNGGLTNEDKFNSTGWFTEAQSKICDRFVAGLRAETFRSSTRTGARQNALTVTGVVPWDNFKFTVDYQVMRTHQDVLNGGTGKARTDNTILAEWMLAF